MKRFRSALAFILALALLFCMTGCAGSETQTTTEPTQASTQEITEPAGTTTESQAITLTDQAGRQVTLEAPAQTLVSCYYITTYSTLALGLGDRVVGLEKKADTRPIYTLCAPELLEKPQVGTLKELNVEAVVALEPDLVLMPVKLQDYAATLEDLGIPVLVVNPESQELLEEMLVLIAAACGVPERAEALLAYYEQQLDKVRERIQGEEAPRVYLASNSSYLSAAPGQMYQSDLITLAGGENVMSQLPGDYWTEVSYESILAADPEVIVIPAGAEYTTQDVLADESLAQVTAVKNGAVYAMPQNLEEWDSPIPSGILGVLWLTSVLHDGVYSFETFQADAVDYYEQFYGFTLDTGLITK